MNTFPNDENGDVLRRMQANGDDLSKPRGIEFEFIFATEQKAKDFASDVRAAHSLKAEPSSYGERKMWQTTVTRTPSSRIRAAARLAATGACEYSQ